jgi:Holliday junction resolvase
MVTNYTQGRNTEYKVVDELRQTGYIAYRTAGSHGPFDVIGLNEKEIVLVQVKSYKKGTKLLSYDKEKELLEKLPVPKKVVKKYFVTYEAGSGILMWEEL